MDISTGATTPTQAKSVELVANGTESVVPDAGYLLSKVDIKVNVPQNNRNNAYFEYKGNQLIKNLKSIDLSSFNTSNVTSMASMFYSCNSLTSLDLSSFNTSNVTSMDSMFNGCYSLTSLTLGANWAPNEKVTSLLLHNSSKLTHDSCLDVLNKLAPRTNSPTLQLHATTKALMSADEIKIATDKGWVVS